MMSDRKKTDKIRSMILGHAIGDALGVPVEFMSRNELVKKPVNEMLGHGTYKDMPKGTWSDDTSMTLALMESIARNNGINYDDIMNNFVRWTSGEFTANGKFFDIGTATRKAIMKYTNGSKPLECGGRSEFDNGNGSLMRISPLVPYLYSRCGTRLDSEAMSLVHDISALTHGHTRSMMACGIYTAIGVHLLDGESIYDATEHGIDEAHCHYEAMPNFKDEIKTYERIWDVEKFKSLTVSNIRSSGYVVDTLEAALWCLLNTGSYRDCVLSAVNLGEDTDTVGAIAGSLAGIHYGVAKMPSKWLKELLRREYIEQLCDDFANALN